jgi:hypothetical protein
LKHFDDQQQSGQREQGEDENGQRKPGLDRRHRDKSGRIERKHGNTEVAALRKEYGASFAKGTPQRHDAQDFAEGNGLSVLARLFAASLQMTHVS